jgi:hypothetical protein
MKPHASMVCVSAALLVSLTAGARAQARDLGGLQQLEARVHVVSARFADDTTAITYVVENVRAGAEDLWGLMVATSATVVRMPNPTRLKWMMATEHRDRAIAQWMMYGELLHGGQTSPELTLVARGVPDLVRYWAVPDVRKHPPIEVDDAEEEPFLHYSDSGTTVGLVPAPSGASAAGLASRLVALLGRACTDLGWIDQPGVCHSLEVKLANAQDAIAAGQAERARGAITAFTNELDGQHGEEPGKHVNDSAYALLSANASYLLSRL